MNAVLVVHIVTGALGILSGFVALYASKGAPLHRRAGMVFVVVMLVMASTGMAVAIARGAAPALNVPAALLTAYLVVTSLATVRPPANPAPWRDRVALGVALGLVVVCSVFGAEAVAAGGRRKGMPAFPFFLFAFVAALGSVGDVRMMRSGPPRGAARLARHLWRMCFALFVAAMSFFLGQADVIPKPIRIPPLLALPPLAVLATMGFWLWRLRRPRARGALPGTLEQSA